MYALLWFWSHRKQRYVANSKAYYKPERCVMAIMVTDMNCLRATCVVGMHSTAQHA